MPYDLYTSSYTEESYSFEDKLDIEEHVSEHMN